MTVRAKTSGSAHEIRDRELPATRFDISVDRISRRIRRGYGNSFANKSRDFARGTFDEYRSGRACGVSLSRMFVEEGEHRRKHR